MANEVAKICFLQIPKPRNIIIIEQYERGRRLKNTYLRRRLNLILIQGKTKRPNAS